MKRPKLVLTVQSVLSRDEDKSLTFVVLLNLLDSQDSKVNTHIRIRPKLPSPLRLIQLPSTSPPSLSLRSNSPTYTPRIYRWSTFPRPAEPTARESSAASTLPTRSPNTRPERLPSSPKESVVTTESNLVHSRLSLEI